MKTRRKFPDNVVPLRGPQPYQARPMRETPPLPRQQRPTLAGLRAEARRDANYVEASLRAPGWADISAPALLARARARQLHRHLWGGGITESVLARARARRRVGGRTPFSLPEFPPAARPPRSSQMAMDDNCAWAGNAWSAQLAVINSVFAEGLVFPGYAFLAEQAQRPEYRRFAEIIATEMTRKWIRISSTSEEDDGKQDKISKINRELDRLRMRDVVRRCLELDELFGRAHLYVDLGTTEDRTELRTSIGRGRDEVSRAKIGVGKLQALRAVEPVWIYPTSYDSNDPLRADWYEPDTWFVMGKEVHSTRLLKFVGREVPDLLKPAYSFGGLSMTQMSKVYVDNWLRTRQSVADIVHAYSVFVLKTNLAATLSNDGGDWMFQRADLFNSLRDNRGLMMVDKDTEDFTNVSAQIGGLEGLQAQTQEHLAAVAGIPIVKLLGIQPTGLNASDEGGIRMFYDWVAAQQEKRMRPQIMSLLDFVQLSLFGEVDEDIVFNFEPLREMDEKEQAEVRKVEAETGISLIDAGVLHPEEERARVAADPDSPYASIDVEDTPDLQEEETEGLDPRAGGGQRGIGKPPRSPEETIGGGEEKEEEDKLPPELSPFQRRVQQRGERHGRREGAFYDRADARVGREMDRDYLRKRLEIGADGSIVVYDKFVESDHPRDASGKFTSGGVGAPMSLSSLKQTGPQLGSNPGGTYEDQNGKKFYVKNTKSKAHAKNEVIASALYALTGARTPTYHLLDDGAGVATDLEKLDKVSAKSFTEAERRKAQEDFAAHAWLANWDAVGLDHDNLVTVGGQPTWVDLGGALEYRAKGGEKGSAFGDSVGEWDSMRDSSKNAQAASVFGDMTKEQLIKSVARVAKISDADIKKAVTVSGGPESLANKLIARKKDLVARSQQLVGGKYEPPSSSAPDKFKSALSAKVKGSSSERVALRKLLKETTDKALQKQIKDKIIESFLEQIKKTPAGDKKAELEYKLSKMGYKPGQEQSKLAQTQPISYTKPVKKAPPPPPVLAKTPFDEKVEKNYSDPAQKMIDAAKLPLTKEEGAHILAYTGHAYEAVNKSLREGLMTEDVWNHVSKLNGALEKLPPHEEPTYRNIYFSPSGSSTDELAAKYKVGMVIEERGFCSSTKKSEYYGIASISFKITGKTGRDISKISQYPEEQEVLFRSGTRFKVVSSSRDANGNHRIELQEVGR